MKGENQSIDDEAGGPPLPPPPTDYVNTGLATNRPRPEFDDDPPRFLLKTTICVGWFAAGVLCGWYLAAIL